MKTRRCVAIALFACVILMLGLPVFAAGSSSKPVLGVAPGCPDPTEESVVAWAKRYYQKYEPRLQGDNKETIESIKTAFFMNKGVKYFMDETVSDLVSMLTVSLTGKKSFDVMVCASALLVENSPKNPRVINLFASVLSAADLDAEALPVYEYGLSLRPNSYLLRLNVANAYLEANKDEKAKAILDKLKFELPEDKAVWRALATYYYKKKNAAMFRECLFKAAKFKGYAKKKKDAKKKQVEENSAGENESVQQLEQKAKQLTEIKPFTSADIIEEDYPNEASQIREKYCKLQGDEKWSLPMLPQVNTTDPKTLKIAKPILKEWVDVFAKKNSEWEKYKLTKLGVDFKKSKKVVRAQAKKAAMAKVQDYMGNAQEMLKYMKSIPEMQTGTNKYKINQLSKKLQEAAKKKNLKLPPTKTPTSDGEDGDKSEQEPTGGPMRPDIDSGSPWAYVNYLNYLEVQRTYETYFAKYYGEFQAKVLDIQMTYAKFSGPENERFPEEIKQLEAMHADGYAIQRATLMHRQRLNSFALSAFMQWTNLYMPQYAQKMKPMLDSYWDISMIYVRSMNDRKVMEREFERVKTNFLHYALIAGGFMTAGGFEYYPETNEELEKLNEEIAAAKKEAKERIPQFEKAFTSPEFDFTKWLEDHFVIEINIAAPGFPAGLGLKVTAKDIQFEANAIIFGGTIKYKPIDNVLETSTGLTIKDKLGINVCGIGGEVGAKVDVYKRTATWDFDKNTYVETDSGSSEVKFKLGPVTAGGKAELDSELTSKTTSKFTVFGDFTVQDQESSKSK